MEVCNNKGLSKLCHLTKNLYNRANFLIKEELKKNNKLLLYNELDRSLKGEQCYRLLSAYTAQHTLKLLSRNWKAYFKALKKWKQQPSKFLVDFWETRGLHTVYIGYNPLWKQQILLRMKTTQMFVSIPFDKLIKLFHYKAEEKGIKVEPIEEEYTSKCSFLDNEFSQKQTKYKVKRVHRGLFRSVTGVLINDDVNVAYNILLKGDPQALPIRSVGGVGGYVIYPLRVSYPAMKL